MTKNLQEVKQTSKENLESIALKILQAEPEEEILKFTEFETKYKVSEDKRHHFKSILEDDLNLKGENFLYVQSGDKYFTLDIEEKVNKFLEGKKSSKETRNLISQFVQEELDLPKFLRFRANDNKNLKRKELTFKKKSVNHNNIQRTEVNLRVDAASEEDVTAFIEGLGYTHAFDVYKYCDIYYTPDAVLVYYVVKDDKNNLQPFIEIEVNEDMDFTEEQAWDIIRKYEKVLEPLGIKPQNRIKKSLFEMYCPS